MASTETSLAGPAALLVLTRVLNVALGLAMVPLLIHALGGDGFAVWAILLSCGALLGFFETGMHSALVRHLAVPLEGGQTEDARFVFSAAVVTFGVVFAILLPAIVLFATDLAAWLRLPDVTLASPGTLLVAVFVAAALRTVLQLGTSALTAARAFHVVATVSFAQSFLSNLAATLAAMFSRRLDVTLGCYWLLQLVVVGVAFGYANRKLGGWQFRSGRSEWGRWLSLLRYGGMVQLSDWAHALIFHLNKVLIVRSLGLSLVTGYEIAGRGMLALRSIPAAGLDTFLPTATIQASKGSELRERARAMLTLSLYGMLIFIGAPLAVAPVLLYGWVGELGYVSRWVFLALGVAAASSVLAMPFATMAQAMGRPGIQARGALVSVCANLAMGWLLVGAYGLPGVALAAAIAVTGGAFLMIGEVHRAFGMRIADTGGALLRSRWPLLLACVSWGTAVYWVFGRWLEATPVSSRYTVPARALALGLSGVLYLGCVLWMVSAQLLLGEFDEAERAVPATIFSWIRRPGPRISPVL